MQYKKKAVHDKLLEYGMQEFLEKGFRAGSISTITEKAEVPVGNMYRYFDGKNGLLDALVKGTYLEIPKLIEQLAWIDQTTVVDIKELMVHLARVVLSLYDQHGKEIVLLVDKCATTRYEDFSEKIIDQVANLVFIKFYGADGKEEDRLMSYLTAKAFVTTIFDIFRLSITNEQRESIILRIMNFYFYELNVRK